MTTSATTEQFDECMKKQIQQTKQLLRVLKSYKEDNIPPKIDEGLYLGSIAAAYNKEALKNYNITHILTVACKIKPPHPADFVYKVIEVVDKYDVDLKQYFNECLDFIDEAKRHGGGVLVHCFAGKSRSVSIVIAYLIKTRGMSFNEALRHVRTVRPTAFPNPGFINQLMDFEKSLKVPSPDNMSQSSKRVEETDKKE